MHFEIHENEKSLLASLKQGFSEVRVFKVGLYPSLVAFQMYTGETVTVGAREEDVAPRFEVFPLRVQKREVVSEAEEIITFSPAQFPAKITLLRKAEWEEEASASVKELMIGNPDGATSQWECNPSEVPEGVNRKVLLDAGVYIRFADGQIFAAATSMFPFALYVNDCDFSETLDLSNYTQIPLAD